AMDVSLVQGGCEIFDEVALGTFAGRDADDRVVGVVGRTKEAGVLADGEDVIRGAGGFDLVGELADVDLVDQVVPTFDGHPAFDVVTPGDPVGEVMIHHAELGVLHPGGAVGRLGAGDEGD